MRAWGSGARARAHLVLAHFVRHRDHGLIALDGGRHCNPDPWTCGRGKARAVPGTRTRVARGRLNDDAVGAPNLALCLGGLKHAACDTVLDRPARVQELALGHWRTCVHDRRPCGRVYRRGTAGPRWKGCDSSERAACTRQRSGCRAGRGLRHPGPSWRGTGRAGARRVYPGKA